MGNLFQELKRRKVFRVAAVYAVVAWLLIQVADTIAPALQLPDWTITLVTILLIFGFLPAVILAWAYEITPEGVKRDPGIESETRGDKIGEEGDVHLAAAESRPDPRSIAVLPFENMSPDPDDAYFSAGIHDEILTQLAKLSALKVISRTSVMEYKNLAKNLREISKELGVATILEGGVQKVGDTVRINVQLIDAETDEHRWADSYDRELTVKNIFEIQREMARSIAEVLKTKLSTKESEHLAAPPTESTRAYTFFLTGNYYFETTDTLNTLPTAVEMYERATKEDPSFALAYARLSRAHRAIHSHGIDTKESRHELGRQALQRALELDPNAPGILLAQAEYEKDRSKALELYEGVLASIPADPDALMGASSIYETMGNPNRSIVLLDQAFECDPRNLRVLSARAQFYSFNREYELANDSFEKMLEIAPDDLIANFLIAWVPVHCNGDVTIMKQAAYGPDKEGLGDFGKMRYRWLVSLYERDFEAALKCLDLWDWEDDPDLSVPHEYFCEGSFRGVALLLSGEREAATPHFLQALERIEAKIAIAPQDFRFYVAHGEALAGLGRYDEAIASAQNAITFSGKNSESEFRGTRSEQQARFDTILRVLLPAGALELGITQLDTYLGLPGLWAIEGLLPDPRLDPLREDPRLEALIEKYGRKEVKTINQP